MKCQYGQMPALGGTKNPDCSNDATYMLGKYRGCNGKQFDHRAPIWYVCDEHRIKARFHYSTVYFTAARKLKAR